MHQAVRSLKPDDVKNSCLSRHATSPWSPAPAIPIFATFTYVYGCRFNRFRKLYKMMQKQREADKGLMLQALWPVALDSKVPRSNATSMHKVDQQNNTGHCVHGSTTFWIQPEDLAGGKKRQSPVQLPESMSFRSDRELESEPIAFHPKHETQPSTQEHMLQYT